MVAPEARLMVEFPHTKRGYRAGESIATETGRREDAVVPEVAALKLIRQAVAEGERHKERSSCALNVAEILASRGEGIDSNLG